MQQISSSVAVLGLWLLILVRIQGSGKRLTGL